MNISELLSRSHHMKPGSAAPFLEGFAEELVRLGHTELTVIGYLDSAIHFGGWIEAGGQNISDIDERIIKAFGEHRCECPGRRRKNRSVSQYYTARVKRFVDYLRRHGVISTASFPTREMASPLDAFRDWLLQHRGLATRTIERHHRLITSMLPALGLNPAYNAILVKKVILERVRGCHPAHAKTIVGALRIYLRFLAAEGACQPGLDHVLPSIAEWRLSSLPRYLDAEQASRLIHSCRSDGPQGWRDRAIVLLLVRLGLRAGDIATMRPGDIDWQQRTLLVRGKGRRDVRLPLPQDAGDAILDYVEKARPRVAIDRVFLCCKAPFRALRSGTVVSGVVRFALRRAGIQDPPSYGANLLRHTAATAMLRAGSTLEEIGTVLRHKSPDTTAHYAKVDVAALQQIAQPWPKEDGAC